MTGGEIHDKGSVSAYRLSEFGKIVLLLLFFKTKSVAPIFFPLYGEKDFC